MRKLLMASVASLGATLAMMGGAKAQPLHPVAPGTLVVHMNGYFQFMIGDEAASTNQIPAYTVAGMPATATYAGEYKLNPITTIGDLRLYPGFDGQTVNGLWYGVATDIRTGYSDASVGQNGKPIVTTSTTTSSISGLYIKRAYGYAGSPESGYVRFGQTDSAFTLLQDGVVEAFGDGGQWTLEAGQAVMFPSNSVPAGGNQFIYSDQSAVYATDKVVYISPVFDGFSFAGGYEPNSNGLKEGYNNDTQAGSPSGNLGASPVFSDTTKRRKNTVDGGVQYADTIDGFKIKASADLLHGGFLNYDGVAALPLTDPDGVDNLNVYQAGGQVTFDGVTLGANVKGGQLLDGYAFKPRGTRDALAFIVGGNYVFGPYVVGASFFDSQSAGSNAPGLKIARTLSEYGVAAGVNYVFDPEFSVFSQYMYGHRHQPGAAIGTFVTSHADKSTYSGNSQGQGIVFGATLKWP